MKKPSYWMQHVAISVANLEESVAWYREMFGFEPVSQDYAPPCRSNIITLSNGAFELELFLHDETQPLSDLRKNPDTDPKEQGVKHFCFGTNDLTALLEELTSKGVKILVGPVPMGAHTICYIQDNSGNPLELMQ